MMKIGDTVALKSIEGEMQIQPVMTITNVKSTARGFWLQFDDNQPRDVWHLSTNYEVVGED